MRITQKKAEELDGVFADVTNAVSDIQGVLSDLQDEDLKGEDRDDVGDQLTNDFDDLVGAVRSFGKALGFEVELDQ
jgi:hypothetical protein